MTIPTSCSTNSSQQRYGDQRLDDPRTKESEEKIKLDKEAGEPRYMEQHPDDPPPYRPTVRPRHSRRPSNGQPYEACTVSGDRREPISEPRSEPRSERRSEHSGSGRRRRPGPMREPRQVANAKIVINPLDARTKQIAQIALAEKHINTASDRFVGDALKASSNRLVGCYFQWAKVLPFIHSQVLELARTEEHRVDLGDDLNRDNFEIEFVHAIQEENFKEVYDGLLTLLNVHAGMERKFGQEYLLKSIHCVLARKEAQGNLTTADDTLLDAVSSALDEIKKYLDAKVIVADLELDQATTISELALYTDDMSSHTPCSSKIPVDMIAYEVLGGIDSALSDDDVQAAYQDFKKIYEKEKAKPKPSSRKESSAGNSAPLWNRGGNLTLLMNLLATFIAEDDRYTTYQSTEEADAAFYFILSTSNFESEEFPDGDETIRPQVIDSFQEEIDSISPDKKCQLACIFIKMLGHDFKVNNSADLTASHADKSASKTSLQGVTGAMGGMRISPQGAQSKPQVSNGSRDISSSQHPQPPQQPPQPQLKPQPQATATTSQAYAPPVEQGLTRASICESAGLPPQMMYMQLQTVIKPVQISISRSITDESIFGEALISKGIISAQDAREVKTKLGTTPYHQVNDYINLMIQRGAISNGTLGVFIDVLIDVGNQQDIENIVSILKKKWVQPAPAQTASTLQSGPVQQKPQILKLKVEPLTERERGIHVRAVDGLLTNSFDKLYTLLDGSTAPVAMALFSKKIISSSVLATATNGFSKEHQTMTLARRILSLPNSGNLAAVFTLLDVLESKIATNDAISFCERFRASLSWNNIHREQYET